ncbi:NAD(P)H-binding domain-containing protein [Sarocladium implicatum]|nr:NAD(P)H-binding domain-containing protein [Sarocladium implicatum]
MSTTNAASFKIPDGSLVLVTGATGFIASQATKQLLERGFRVRGTVRNLHSASWLISAFHQAAGSGRFELAMVPDYGKDGAFDEVMKGVSGILHIATSPLDKEGGGFEEDPDVAIPGAIKDVNIIFEAAMREPSVKSFVFTGSIAGATLPAKGNDTRVDHDTYNEQAIQLARAPDQPAMVKGFFVYAASQAMAEKEFMKLLAEKKPRFSGNVVSPSGVVGAPLHVKHSDNPRNWATVLYKGQQERIDGIPSMFLVDVKDVALVHIAALLDPDTDGQRFQTWGRALSWVSILKVAREIRPEKEWLPDPTSQELLTITADQAIAEKLLKKFGNREWLPLEQSLVDSFNNPYFKLSVGP